MPSGFRHRSWCSTRNTAHCWHASIAQHTPRPQGASCAPPYVSTHAIAAPATTPRPRLVPLHYTHTHPPPYTQNRPLLHHLTDTAQDCMLPGLQGVRPHTHPGNKQVFLPNSLPNCSAAALPAACYLKREQHAHIVQYSTQLAAPRAAHRHSHHHQQPQQPTRAKPGPPLICMRTWHGCCPSSLHTLPPPVHRPVPLLAPFAVASGPPASHSQSTRASISQPL